MFCAAAALKIGKKFHLWFKMYENTNWIDLVRGINYSRHQYPTRSPCCCTLTVFENILSGARFGKMLMLKLLWPHVLKDTTTIADTWVPITKGGNHTIIKGGIPTNWVKRPTLPSIGMQSGPTLTFRFRVNQPAGFQSPTKSPARSIQDVIFHQRNNANARLWIWRI